MAVQIPTTAISTLTALTTTASALSNLILVSPQNVIGYQPQNVVTPTGVIQGQPKPLLFHYEGEQTASFESDITDHFVEDNTAIQDQISLKPETITTHGFIGELNDVPPPVLAQLQVIANTLVSIGAYTPQLSATAIIAYDDAFQLYQIAASALNTSVQAWAALSQSAGESVVGATGFESQSSPFLQTQQQKYFQQFYGYWRNRVLFTVQTPWCVFKNMAIQNFRAVQDAETRMITDFEIKFKMIRFSTSQTLTQTEANLEQGRLIAQAQAGNPVNLGSQSGTLSSESFSTRTAGIG